MSRVTVRNQPSESGLARVGQGPRGLIVKVDGEDVAKVCAHGGDWSRPLRGWYFYGSSKDGRIPRINTCDSPLPTKEAARDACVAYVKECLAKAVLP